MIHKIIKFLLNILNISIILLLVDIIYNNVFNNILCLNSHCFSKKIYVHLSIENEVEFINENKTTIYLSSIMGYIYSLVIRFVESDLNEQNMLIQLGFRRYISWKTFLCVFVVKIIISIFLLSTLFDIEKNIFLIIGFIIGYFISQIIITILYIFGI